MIACKDAKPPVFHRKPINSGKNEKFRLNLSTFNKNLFTMIHKVWIIYTIVWFIIQIWMQRNSNMTIRQIKYDSEHVCNFKIAAIQTVFENLEMKVCWQMSTNIASSANSKGIFDVSAHNVSRTHQIELNCCEKYRAVSVSFGSALWNTGF